MAVVWIPPLLQRHTGGIDKVTVPGATLRQVINSLDALYPGIKDSFLEKDGGRIQPGLAVAIDGETNHLGLIETVKEDSEIHFIPAISGG